MDAHDDLARLFRQVGAVADGYREFAAPALPDTLPAAEPITRVDAALPATVPRAPGAVTPLTLGVLQPVARTLG